MFESNKNITYKFTSSFWDQYSKQEHYFKGSVLLEESKLLGYLSFFKNINLSNALVLKTDLYVEAKNKNDNFFPYLKINQCVGMDISLEIVKMAKQNLIQFLPNMKFVVADVRHLPFKKNSFSAVISDSTLDHIPRKDLSRALLEAKRIIRNKGKFILSLNNIFNLLSIYDSFIKNLFFNNYFTVFYFNPKRILKLLANLGFKTINWDCIVRLDCFGLFLTKLSNRIKGVNILAREWLFTGFNNFPLLKMFFCLQFIILAEKAGEEN